jgi:hypothetical protein
MLQFLHVAIQFLPSYLAQAQAQQELVQVPPPVLTIQAQVPVQVPVKGL